MDVSPDDLLRQMQAKWALQDSERKQERERRRGESEKDKDPKESSEAFLTDFNHQQSEIKEGLAALCRQQTTSTDSKALQETLDVITTRVFQV